MEVSEEGLGEFFEFLAQHLDERQRRLVAGSMARLLGHGGIKMVAEASGMSRNTVIDGAKAFDAGEAPLGRVRAVGGGRPLTEELDPTLLSDLESLIEPETRGDPMSALRWTVRSTRQLARSLVEMGHTVSHSLVGILLHELGYSLQATAKVVEGNQHPDRGGQFDHINTLAAGRLAAGEPVISVDCKKKELVNGTKANAGREWHRKGQPERVDVHDFPDKNVPKAIPYGVLDIGGNEGWMSVGDDHDTAAFAVNAIRRWWQTLGSVRYPQATTLMVTADAGGSNGYRNRLYKAELARLATETGLTITVCHYPPGTSKWNKIEHRMFSFITKNWRGKPLTSYQVIVDLVAATTTTTGLSISAEWDQGDYPKGIEITLEFAMIGACVRPVAQRQRAHRLSPRRRRRTFLVGALPLHPPAGGGPDHLGHRRGDQRRQPDRQSSDQARPAPLCHRRGAHAPSHHAYLELWDRPPIVGPPLCEL